MEHRTVCVNGVNLHLVQAGEQGAALILLHGFPQTWLIWRYVLPAFAQRYRVLAMDLRGYGDSDKPASGYDKGTMAEDVRALMDRLEIERALVVGHDRGARVARRLGLEHPSRVAGVVLLDILPLEWVYSHMDDQTARLYWHWIFHLIPELPEQLIRGNEEAYLQHFFGRSPGLTDDAAAMAEYLRCFRLPGAVEAALSDYRDAYFVDRPRYLADRAAGRKLEVPALLLWGAESRLGGLPVLDIWREVAVDVRGEEVPHCGHYVPEEQPELVIDRVLRFAAETLGA